MTMSPRVPPCPDSVERIPGPNYQIPPPPPLEVKDTVKPLMILKLRPGVTISKQGRDELMTQSEQVGKALNSGGGLILDGNLVEPLILIYGGQVIRFDVYEEEDPGEISGEHKLEPPPRPARRTQEDRDTW